MKKQKDGQFLTTQKLPYGQSITKRNRQSFQYYYAQQSTITSTRVIHYYFLQNNQQNIIINIQIELYHWLKYKESMWMKLQRWVLGIQNIVPKSIEEQRIEDINLKTHTQDILIQYYQDFEKQLYYGVTRKLVCRCLKNMSVFDDQTEKVGYYRMSGYWKKRNQVVSGFNQREFLQMFEKFLEIKRKKIKDSYYKEELFLQEFIIQLDENLEKQKKWEDEFYNKRSEFIKSIPHLENSKKTIINELQIERQSAEREKNKQDFSTIRSKKEENLNDEIEKTVKAKGLQGLSLKEKKQICANELTLQKTFYRNYIYKIKNSENQNKIDKYEEKAKHLRVIIQEKEQEYAYLSDQLQTLYKD